MYLPQQLLHIIIDTCILINILEGGGGVEGGEDVFLSEIAGAW